MSAAGLVGVAAATVLVLGVALWARRDGQKPGQHRPELIHRRQSAIAGLAAVLDTLVPGMFSEDDSPLPFLPAPDYRDEPDDWTADLPTEAFPAVVEPSPAARAGLDILNQSIRNAGLIAAGKDPEPYARHTSPSETAAEIARRRWGIETPIFAELARERGYHPIHRFDGRAAA